MAETIPIEVNKRIGFGVNERMKDKQIFYILLNNFSDERQTKKNCLSFMVKKPEFTETCKKLLRLCVLEYTKKVKDIMLVAGADKQYVDKIVTEDEIKYAIANDIKAEDFAWGLLF